MANIVQQYTNLNDVVLWTLFDDGTVFQSGNSQFAGNVGIGPLSTPGQIDTIAGEGTPFGLSTLDVAISYDQATTPDNTAVAGAISVEANPSADNATGLYYANFNTASTATGNPFAINLLAGFSSAVSHLGSGTVGILEGAELFVLNGADGPITTEYGMFISIGSTTGSTGPIGTSIGVAVVGGADGSGTITSNIGVRISTPFVVGQLTHNYAIKVEDQTPGGVNNPDSYAFHSSGGKFHIAGLGVHANNAAAIAAGLVAGDLYRTGADPDVVCVVH